MLAASVVFADPAQDRQYKPGETFKDCAECPEMVVIPAGSFMMGSPEHEEGRIYLRRSAASRDVFAAVRDRQICGDL